MLLVPLTWSSRCLAFSPGSRRSPAVAFRTTGVRVHMEEGTLDWATSSSSWMPAVHWTDRRRQRGQDTLTETDLIDATCQQQH